MNWSKEKHNHDSEVWTFHDLTLPFCMVGVKLTLIHRSEFWRATVTRWRMSMMSHVGGHTEKHTDEIELLFLSDSSESDARAFATSVMGADTVDGAYALAETHSKLREL